ncbi:hypothetical protein AB0G81_29295, partial [Streptomyces asoensis]|uniref:hypothetical protein n=1 Tax=Streptomyces asoensis TaxID=249586 RepID=UPI0033DD253A
MWESVVFAALAATVRIALQVVAWRREAARDRERRRLLLAALRLAGRGVRLEERRAVLRLLLTRGQVPLRLLAALGEVG